MDRKTAPDYILDNFRKDDRVAVVLLNKQTGRVLQRVAAAEKISEDRYQAWLRHMNASQYEVYISMNTLKPGAHGRTKADIKDVRHVYLDVDEGGQDKVNTLLSRHDLPLPNWVLETSPGKFQVIWRVDGFDTTQAETLMHSLVESTGADPAATDVSRVLRLPGFRNHKYGGHGHLITATRLHAEVARIEQFALPDALDRRHERNYSRVRHTGTGPISQSERDWAYAKRSLRRGEATEDVIRAIEEHRTDKPNPRYYARHTVEKAAGQLSR